MNAAMFTHVSISQNSVDDMGLQNDNHSKLTARKTNEWLGENPDHFPVLSKNENLLRDFKICAQKQHMS